jgi:hypothetical protein
VGLLGDRRRIDREVDLVDDSEKNAHADRSDGGTGLPQVRRAALTHLA